MKKVEENNERGKVIFPEFPTAPTSTVTTILGGTEHPNIPDNNTLIDVTMLPGGIGSSKNCKREGCSEVQV